MYRYKLSNRQLKELLVRGVEITIAIPAPIDEIDDELEFARRHIVLDDPQHVVSAHLDEVAVNPLVKSDTGLTSIIGRICGEQNEGWNIAVCVIIAVLRTTDRPRHRSSQPQWPAEVAIGDRWIGGSKGRPGAH